MNASSDLIAFLESNPALNKLLGDMNKSLSNQDHWDLLIDKFINGQKQKGRTTRRKARTGNQRMRPLLFSNFPKSHSLPPLHFDITVIGGTTNEA